MLKRRIITILLLVICIIFVGCKGNNDEQVIATVNGEDLYLKEALFWLKLTEIEFETSGEEDIWKTSFDGRSAEEVAKEKALESALKAKILSQKADDMNIELSEEDIQAAHIKAKELVIIISQDEIERIGLTEEDITDLIIENMKGVKVLHQIDVPIDDKAIEAIVDAQLSNYIDSQTKIRAEILCFPIVGEDRETIKQVAYEAYEKALEGIKFSDLLNNKKIKGYLNTDYENQEIVKGTNDVYDNYLFNLNEDEVAIIEIDDEYQVIKVKQYIYPDEDIIKKVEENMINIAILEIQQEAFEEFYQECKKVSVIDVNNQLWDNIKIKQ